MNLPVILYFLSRIRSMRIFYFFGAPGHPGFAPGLYKNFIFSLGLFHVLIAIIPI